MAKHGLVAAPTVKLAHRPAENAALTSRSRLSFAAVGIDREAAKRATSSTHSSFGLRWSDVAHD
jgi:hypothetical protein